MGHYRNRKRVRESVPRRQEAIYKDNKGILQNANKVDISLNINFRYETKNVQEKGTQALFSLPSNGHQSVNIRFKPGRVS